MGGRAGGAAQGPSTNPWDRATMEQNVTSGVDQALAGGNQFMPNVNTGTIAGYNPASLQQPTQQAPQAPAAPNYGGSWGGGFMGINNQQIQEAIARWQQQQNPTAATPPPAPETTPVAEPPPPPAGGEQFNLAGEGGIVDRLYGGNSSQSERLTNGLNYAQAPTYAPNPVSSLPPGLLSEGQATDPNAAGNAPPAAVNAPPVGTLAWFEQGDNDFQF